MKYRDFHYPPPNRPARADVKATIYVDVDWGSTGIWIVEPGLYANADYALFDLPEWLVERFDYWTWWFNGMPFGGFSNQTDWEEFTAYGRSLAIDLKLVLGNEYEVRYGRTEIHVPIPKAPEDLERIPKKMRKHPRPTLFDILRKHAKAQRDQ